MAESYQTLVQVFLDHLRSMRAGSCHICDGPHMSISLAWPPAAIERVCHTCGHIQLFNPRVCGLTIVLRPGAHGAAYPTLARLPLDTDQPEGVNEHQ